SSSLVKPARSSLSASAVRHPAGRARLVPGYSYWHHRHAANQRVPGQYHSQRSAILLHHSDRGMIPGVDMNSIFKFSVPKIIVLTLSFFFILILSCYAQWVQQTIQLKLGWNAVFLEARPDPAVCDALFA